MNNLVEKALADYEKSFLASDIYKDSWDKSYQESCLADMRKLVASSDNYLLRENHFAHFTASAMVVSKDLKRVVLLHHKKLEKWLQPGGHADGDADLAQVALKEASEETGIVNLKLFENSMGIVPIDLDIHEIPARKSDPSHYHYDVRFLIQATDSEKLVINHESNALKWLSFEEVREQTDERSVIRMLDKLESGEFLRS